MISRHNQTPKEESFSKWYNRAIRDAGLIADSPTQGVWTLLPRAAELWNNIRNNMTRDMGAIGIREVIMPTLFPMSLLEREADHVDGFAPEVFTVTKAGPKDLEDPLVARPTSEVVASELMKDLVTSYRDLPVTFNQWSSAFRAERRPRPLLRTTEFLWQEGYSAHGTSKEADEHARCMADFYAKFMEEYLCIASITGTKSDNERFPGAVATYALEAQFGGRALQLATSHNLGNGFALSHNIKYLDKDGQLKEVYQTSWGSSTRMIGALVMAHGDKDGVVLPPQVAPEVVTIIPAWRNEDDKSSVEAYVHNLRQALGDRAIIAKREPGERLGPVRFRVDRGGSPIQLVVGPREIENGTASYKLRHSGGQGEINTGNTKAAIDDLNTRAAGEMLAASRAKREDSITVVDGGKQALIDAVNDGQMVLAGWSGTAVDEKLLKEQTGGITIRVHPHNHPDRRDPLTGKSGKAAIFAKAY